MIFPAMLKPLVYTVVCMGSPEYRTLRLTRDAYRQLKRRRRDDESFSGTVSRLAGERSLLDLAGILTDEEAEEMRAAIEKQQDRTYERLDHRTERLDS